MGEQPGTSNWFNVDGRDGLVVAVGENSSIAMFRDGGLSWHEVTVGGGVTFDGVWVADALTPTVWIVGAGPKAWLLEGASHTPAPRDLPTSRSGTLYDVWGFDADDVWAVGEHGLVFHFSGSGWDLVESGTRNNLERVRGRTLSNGQRELFIVGQYGTVLRYVY
jgi:photosystem II stability/assembly factor-like uncharacterized protein